MDLREDVWGCAMSQLISDRQFLKIRIFCPLSFLFSLLSIKVSSLTLTHFILSPVCLYINLFFRHKSTWFCLFSGLSCPVSVFRAPSPPSIGPLHSCKKAPLQINVWITRSPSPRSDSWCIMYDTYGSTRSVLSVSARRARGVLTAAQTGTSASLPPDLIDQRRLSKSGH